MPLSRFLPVSAEAYHSLLRGPPASRGCREVVVPQYCDGRDKPAIGVGENYKEHILQMRSRKLF